MEKKEFIENLACFETNFETAIQYRYSRPLTRGQLKEISDTYLEFTGVQIPLKASCSSCRMKILTEVGKVYFAVLKELNEEEQVVASVPQKGAGMPGQEEEAANKVILQYDKEGELIREWNSFEEIEKENNYNLAKIKNCIAGKTKTAFTYKWGYKEP